MKIRAGYEIGFECAQPTPMLLMLSVHPSRVHDLLTPENMTFDPPLPSTDYRDGFGNVCTRMVAPSGPLTIKNEFLIADSGEPDPVPDAPQIPVADLPDELLVYLLGSRYCDTDALSNKAWQLFGHTEPGCARVRAICDYVHERVTFGYEHARATRTASEGHEERRGVCRDFAHLAITFCRCMNLPARYVTGYLGDFGVPPDPAPMDFSAWFQVWLGDRWHTFDARHNRPRIGRILMATGRDATDVAISTSFGTSTLTAFRVVSDDVTESADATTRIAV